MNLSILKIKTMSIAAVVLLGLPLALPDSYAQQEGKGLDTPTVRHSGNSIVQNG